ncbi:MAG: acetylornithine carbamoyltransferase [Edaphocola sp.]
MKQFISANDVADINDFLAKALHYKAQPFKDKDLGVGKRVGLLFFNPSLRTRLSTQLAAQNLGMEPIVFNAGGDGWALEFAEGAVMNGKTVEHIKDAAPVLGAYFDILCVRTFPSLTNRDEDYAEKVLGQIKKYSGVPVVSLESATLHPLQSFADVITIAENKPKGRKPKVVLTWAPHIKPIPQCVSNSFAQWMGRWEDVDLTIAHPQGFELAEQFTQGAAITHDQQEALRDADFVYVKNWSSYKDYGKVHGGGGDWMLTEEKLKTAPNARIMHCLPVRRNVELSDELLDGSRSLVTEQAKNRVWSAQTVLAEILKGL